MKKEWKLIFPKNDWATTTSQDKAANKMFWCSNLLNDVHSLSLGHLHDISLAPLMVTLLCTTFIKCLQSPTLPLTYRTKRTKFLFKFLSCTHSKLQSSLRMNSTRPFCGSIRGKEKLPEIFMQERDLISAHSFTDMWLFIFLSTLSYTGCIY